MSSAHAAWRTTLISQTDALIAVAMYELGDANEAHWLVHGVMMDALAARDGAANLDGALRRALHTHPAPPGEARHG
ncbi:hypothetical protein [Terricaulis sp.]|uniref:hypothetical protein n=1 Tax=Terricaulis sp. TaxID=2768686 RepID=UPI003784F623